MKKHILKSIIGTIYLVISIILILLTSKDKIFLYLGFSSLGLSLRAFYFTLIEFEENPKDGFEGKDTRRCIADYFLVYPLFITAIFSLVHLLFLDSLMDIWLKDVYLNPALSILSLYIGFDIYRLAGRLP